MFTYQKTNRYFAQTAGGLEEPAVDELRELGARELKPVFRGVHFSADRESLYRVIYRTRLCSRILALLLNFDCHSTRYLYKTARKLPWQELLSPDKTLAITATVADSRINHSRYAALRLKDAVVDFFRDRTGRRPDIDTRTPDVRLNLHIQRNRAAISLDLSGGALHRRGYREVSVTAPMQETLAAAIIRLTGWEGGRPLIDPMCGSGTLLSEALMHYCRIPAGYLRRDSGVSALPDHDPALWQRIRRAADQAIRPLPAGLIQGGDKDRGAVEAARTNCRLLPHGELVTIDHRPFQAIDRLRDLDIVANPPHGIRLGRKNKIAGFLKEFGDFLKQRCTGSTAYLYFGDRQLLKMIGLRPAWKKSLAGGGRDGVLARYDLY